MKEENNDRKNKISFFFKFPAQANNGFVLF